MKEIERRERGADGRRSSAKAPKWPRGITKSDPRELVERLESRGLKPDLTNKRRETIWKEKGKTRKNKRKTRGSRRSLSVANGNQKRNTGRQRQGDEARVNGFLTLPFFFAFFFFGRTPRARLFVSVALNERRYGVGVATLFFIFQLNQERRQGDQINDVTR